MSGSGSGWYLPPLGWCCTCLIAYDRETPAVVLWKGNSLCAPHLHAVLEDDITQAVKDAVDADDADEDGPG